MHDERIVQYVCHLITPGIDSICAYFWIIAHYPINYNLVHISVSPRYSHIEKKILQEKLECKLGKEIIYLDLNILNCIREDPDGFIPGRNLFFASLLDTTTILPKDIPAFISYGATADDRVYDSSIDFFHKASSALSPHTTMGSLVRHLSKTNLVKWFLNHDMFNYNKKEKIEIILNTFSCFQPNGENECLACSACFRKNVVLHATKLVTRPFFNDLLIENRIKSIFLDCTVSLERKNDTKDYLKVIDRWDETHESYLKREL